MLRLIDEGGYVDPRTDGIQLRAPDVLGAVRPRRRRRAL